MDKKRIGIVVQRYGLEVNGGAELHARMIAERLAGKYDVTVLTSRALDYHVWEPEYPAGETTVNGIRVIRFNNTVRVSGHKQYLMDRRFRERQKLQKIWRWMGRPHWFVKLFPSVAISDKDGEKWLMLQGPGMPDLVDYLKQHENEYAAFIFFSAIYYPAAMGILTVPHKSIVVPTMHDERPAYYPIYKKVMASARWILFNSKAEQEFSERLFPISHVQKRITAVGIDPADDFIDSKTPQEFGINQPYFIYVGRIDKAKGCDVMIEYFKRFSEQEQTGVQLVLAGKPMMEKVVHPAIVYTGFIGDNEKEQLIKQAKALIIPSVFESLSLVLLESFACKVPVIATGQSEVLKDHIEESGGGWLFTDYNGFKNILCEIVKDKAIVREKGEAGFRYLSKKYTWERVMRDFDEAIEGIGS